MVYLKTLVSDRVDMSADALKETEYSDEAALRIVNEAIKYGYLLVRERDGFVSEMHPLELEHIVAKGDAFWGMWMKHGSGSGDACLLKKSGESYGSYCFSLEDFEDGEETGMVSLFLRRQTIRPPKYAMNEFRRFVEQSRSGGK